MTTYFIITRSDKYSPKKQKKSLILIRKCNLFIFCKMQQTYKAKIKNYMVLSFENNDLKKIKRII